MFLGNLKEQTDEQLQEKINTIDNRMRYMQHFGSHSNKMYEQCLFWMQEIETELFERRESEITDEWKPGTVAIIGENSLEAEELNKKEPK